MFWCFLASCYLGNLLFINIYVWLLLPKFFYIQAKKYISLHIIEDCERKWIKEMQNSYQIENHILLCMHIFILFCFYLIYCFYFFIFCFYKKIKIMWLFLILTYVGFVQIYLSNPNAKFYDEFSTFYEICKFLGIILVGILLNNWNTIYFYLSDFLSLSLSLSF